MYGIKVFISINDAIFEATVAINSEAFGWLNADAIDMGIKDMLLLILSFYILIRQSLRVGQIGRLIVSS